MSSKVDDPPSRTSTAEGTVVNEKNTAVSTPNPEVASIDAKGETTESEETVYPTGLALIPITIGLCLAVFVIALDNTIIATAIPKITNQFNSLDDVGWYGSAYFLTLTSLQPSFGKIYANFNVKFTFLIALLLFEVGSVICAAATSSEMFIVGRAVAGVGASAIFAGAVLIMTYTVPLHKRPAYLGIISSMWGIASVVGPLMGGAFTDRATWRWCFWINLPFGGITALGILFFFKEPKRKFTETSLRKKISQIDLLGAFFLITAIVCLLLALQWGGTTYAWNNSKIWGLFLGFGLLIIVFLVIQFWKGDDATIPFNIFKKRNVWISSIFMALFTMTIFTHMYYLAFYFQAVKGTSAVQSGIRTIPLLVSMTLSSIVVGGLITTLGVYHWFFWGGGVLLAVGAGMIQTLDVDSKIGKWLGYQVIVGLGGGAGFQIPMLAVQVVLSDKEIPVGNALVMFFNTLGGAIGLSVAQNVFQNELVKNIYKSVPGVDPFAILHGSGATGIKDAVSLELLRPLLQAYANALRTAFIPPVAFAGAAFIVSLFITRVNVKGKNLAPGGA